MSAESSRQPIQFFNRYTGQVETEKVYGERWLRWAYETGPGRLSVEMLAKRAWFSRWYGWRMDLRGSRRLIEPFIRKYELNGAEFDEPGAFESFNDFFARRLKPESRPIDINPERVVFPADGRHIGIQNLAKNTGFWVKGQRLNLAALLGELPLAKRYASGTAVFSRLCPVDYHRFHFCAKGLPGAPRLVPGPLYSVSPIALRRSLDYLFHNKRHVTQLETERFGLVTVLEIGATNVGSIRQRFIPGQVVAKGQEKGWFEFGGSAVLTLFEPGVVRLADDLVEQAAYHREVYARMGDWMAVEA